ncbi:MAG TPA: sigma-54 dependent transcriptional regulator [Methylomirabilota bacterium]|nr:sigma-54 dependent transcriptional regulator [Methylomirabilota bacterium]
MAAVSGRILIADDQRDVREALRLLFKGEGYRTETTGSPPGVMELLRQSEFELLLMDLNYERDTTSGREGMELLRQVRAVDDSMPVVVMTAWGSVNLAVEAMRHGAQDFIEKPWDNERLLSIVRNQLALGKARRESRRLEAAHGAQQGEGSPAFIAESPVMRPVLEAISRVGPSNAAILITGENGTGKGLVARALHAVSPRSQRAFVTVNMGGMSEGVFESELFGHVRGAFTDAKQDRMGRLEMAEGGTVFLDEIANAPPGQQARLLRALETGEYERVGSSRTRRADVRFLSATNADLPAEVAAGRFRQDLLFRLNTVEIHLPALRDRPEDILPLAERFLAEHGGRYRKPVTRFHPDALELMRGHSWPGNVRELGHAVERAVLMCAGQEIRPADLGLGAGREVAPGLDDMSLEEVERYLIKRTLARCGGNARDAAAALGLSRSAFYRRLEKFGL